MASSRNVSPPFRIVGPGDPAEAPAATPKDEFPTNEAITRKVRNPLLDAAAPATPPPLTATAAPGTAASTPALRVPVKSPQLSTALHTKRLLLLGAAVFCAVVGVAGLWKVLRRPVAGPARASLAATPSPSPPAAQSSALPPSAPPAATSHIDITVQPAGGTLVLDGTAAGGNRIKAEVPRAEGRHVVEASAPGYEPFKKTISFATDVYLDIELKHSRPAPVHGSARGRAPQVPSEARSPQQPAEDFGMTLERPATRRPTKKIDEKDPYAP